MIPGDRSERDVAPDTTAALMGPLWGHSISPGAPSPRRGATPPPSCTLSTKGVARGFIPKRQRMLRAWLELLARSRPVRGALVTVDEGRPGVADGTADEGR